MTEHQNTAELARTFTEAWTSGRMDEAATYLANDVVFDGPGNVTTGKAAYLQGLGAFARGVSGLSIRAAYGDDGQAVIVYDLINAAGLSLTYAELLTFRDGLIATDKLIFDTYKARTAQAAQRPADA